MKYNRLRKQIIILEDENAELEYTIKSLLEEVAKLKGFKDTIVLQVSYIIGDKTYAKRLIGSRDEFSMTKKVEDNNLVINDRKSMAFILNLDNVVCYWVDFLEVKEEPKEEPKKDKKKKDTK